jgi:hypothetical protein
MSTQSLSERSLAPIYKKQTLIKGKPAQIECIDINGQTFTIDHGIVRTLRLEDEWYEDLASPEAVLRWLAQNPQFKIDIFTFWQRLPDLSPKYQYYTEYETIAVLPIKSYEDWWNTRIKSRVRSLIRKSEKEGVRVIETTFDDRFVSGMTKIFNEAEYRQGRRFWHYGKSEADVKRQFSTYIKREHMIGAYLGDEMIGFVMLGHAGAFGLTGQILSSIHHRDKFTTNALMAKAVDVCAKLQLRYLCYIFWGDDTLTEFKRRCGFEPMIAPRYFVPMTSRGHLSLRVGAHHGVRGMIPPGIVNLLKQWRRRWVARRSTD